MVDSFSTLVMSNCIMSFFLLRKLKLCQIIDLSIAETKFCLNVVLDVFDNIELTRHSVTQN